MNEIQYQAEIDLSVENNSHTIAYKYIEKIAQGELLQILEVGCSTAYFGRALKEAGHTVWGVEPNQSSANKAEKQIDHVFVGTVEEFVDSKPDIKFDVITFGDVLEHVINPSNVLRRCRGLLEEEGAIVASVPNVAHIVIRAMLLDSQWEYGGLGILDRTHLRFFTRKTVEELFNSSQYIVADIKAVKLSAEAAADACMMTLNHKAVDYVDAYSKDDHKYDFQYVLIAVPAGTRAGRVGRLLLEDAPTRILVAAQDSTCSIVDVRLRVSLDKWAATCNGEVKIKSIYDCDEQCISWSDIVIIQRVADHSALRIVDIAKKHEKKVIFEIDDLLIDLPDFLSHHKAGLLGYHGALESMLPYVDCITVTTERLAKQLKKYSRPIKVIPNFVGDDGLGRVSSDSWQDGMATLIVASSDAVRVDFILHAISMIIERTDISVSVVVIGPTGAAFDKAGIRVIKEPIMEYGEFKKYIRTLTNPIGIIPLDDSLFSSCKSPVKHLDYSLAGIPVICSNVPPYSDVLLNGDNVIFVENESSAWIGAIEELVMSVATRVALSNRAYTFVSNNYSLDNSVRYWDTLFFTLRRECISGGSLSAGLGLSRKRTHLRFLVSHIFNFESYKAAIRLLKQDGIKSLVARLVRGLF